MKVFLVLTGHDFKVVVKCETEDEALAIAKHKYHEAFVNPKNPTYAVHELDRYLEDYDVLVTR